jgi:hypothetical protein
MTIKKRKSGNELVSEQIKAKISGMISEANSAIAINHPGLKGEVREILLKEYFKPLLTKGFSCGTGIIVDSTNQQSPQTDLIIYSTNYLPPLLFSKDEDKGIFPIESCFYAFEVKTKLTSEELRTSIEKFKKIRNLEMLTESDIFQTTPVGKSINTVLFAFDSDLTIQDELERYKKYDTDADSKPAVNILCIVGKGYWFFANDRWNTLAEEYSLDQVLWFTAGVLNTLPIMDKLRGIPKFGHYFGGELSLKIIDE